MRSLPGFPCSVPLWSKDEVSLDWIQNSRLHPTLRRNALEETTYKDRVRELDGNTKLDPSPYLRSAFLPEGHRAYLFFDVSTIKKYRELAWKWASFQELTKSNMPYSRAADNETKWDMVSNFCESSIGVSYYSTRRAEFLSLGYTILQGMADPLNMPASVRNDSEVPEKFPTQSMAEFMEAFHQSFTGEEDMKDEKNWDNWRPTVNLDEGNSDANNRLNGVIRESSTRLLRVGYMEQEDNMWMASYASGLDLWYGWLLSLMDVDEEGRFKMNIIITGGRFLLTGQNCPDQT